MPRPIKKKNSPNWHYDFVRDGRRFQGSTGTSDHKLARQVIDRLYADILLPARTRPPITLDQAAGLYADQAEQHGSWATSSYVIDALLAGLGEDRLLSEITQIMLVDHFARRRMKPDGNLRANSSINREIDVASAIWNRADKARFDVGDMPDFGALRLGQEETRWHLLDPGAAQADYLAALRPDVRDAVEFLLLTGWRRSEMLGLTWKNVDLGRAMAWTRVKGGRQIERPLTPAMIAIIANQPKVGPHVFTYICHRATASGGAKGRAPRRHGDRYKLTITVLRAAHQAARASIGAPELRLHDLRHTRATRILEATDNLAVAQKALGHRNIKTTQRYAHVRAEKLRAALVASEPTPAPVPHNKRTKAKK